jgi:hypothetical protein
MDMRRIERLDTFNFWPILENREFLNPGARLNFTDATGYHVYADLRLRLDVSAPEDDGAAMKCLGFLGQAIVARFSSVPNFKKRSRRCVLSSPWKLEDIGSVYPVRMAAREDGYLHLVRPNGQLAWHQEMPKKVVTDELSLRSLSLAGALFESLLVGVPDGPRTPRKPMGQWAIR